MLRRLLSRWLAPRPLFSADTLQVIEELRPDQVLVLQSDRDLSQKEVDRLGEAWNLAFRGKRAMILSHGMKIEVLLPEQPVPGQDPEEAEHAKDASGDESDAQCRPVAAKPLQGGFEPSA
jgi:hypothetical protein